MPNCPISRSEPYFLPRGGDLFHAGKSKSWLECPPPDSVRGAFVPAERYHKCDIVFVSRVVGTCPDTFSGEDYRQRTRLHNQGRILDLQDSWPFNERVEGPLVAEIGKMSRVHLNARAHLPVRHSPTCGNSLAATISEAMKTKDSNDETYGSTSRRRGSHRS